MADTFPTLADVAVFDFLDIEGVSNVLEEAPVLQRLYAETTPGQDFRYERKTAAPVVGFRQANAGREFSSGVHEEIIYPLAILDASFGVDVAVAAADRRGTSACLGMHMNEHLMAAFFAWERQLFDAGLAAGFTSLPAQIDASMKLANETPSLGEISSPIYAIRTGPLDVGLTMGETGRVRIGDTIVQDFLDASGLHLPRYYTPITMWTGTTVKSTYSAASIDAAVNIDDDVFSDLYSLFPSNRKPNLFVTTRQGLKKLQQSRTATNPTGAPAPFPTDWTAGPNNIPILTTEAIVDTAGT
jgi:hypothetical protein